MRQVLSGLCVPSVRQRLQEILRRFSLSVAPRQVGVISPQLPLQLCWWPLALPRASPVFLPLLQAAGASPFPSWHSRLVSHPQRYSVVDSRRARTVFGQVPLSGCHPALPEVLCPPGSQAAVASLLALPSRRALPASREVAGESGTSRPCPALVGRNQSRLRLQSWQGLQLFLSQSSNAAGCLDLFARCPVLMPGAFAEWGPAMKPGGG